MIWPPKTEWERMRERLRQAAAAAWRRIIFLVIKISNSATKMAAAASEWVERYLWRKKAFWRFFCRDIYLYWFIDDSGSMTDDRHTRILTRNSFLLLQLLSLKTWKTSKFVWVDVDFYAESSQGWAEPSCCCPQKQKSVRFEMKAIKSAKKITWNRSLACFQIEWKWWPSWSQSGLLLLSSSFVHSSPELDMWLLLLLLLLLSLRGDLNIKTC